MCRQHMFIFPVRHPVQSPSKAMFVGVPNFLPMNPVPNKSMPATVMWRSECSRAPQKRRVALGRAHALVRALADVAAVTEEALLLY